MITGQRLKEEFNVSYNKASNGEEAVEKIRQRIELYKQGKAEPYKVLFLDYSMPIMGGVEAATKIKELYEEAEDDCLKLPIMVGNSSY